MHHLAMKKEELSHSKAINNNAKDIQEVFNLPGQPLDWDGPAKIGPDGIPDQPILNPKQLDEKRRMLTKLLRDKFVKGELTQAQYEMMQEKISEDFSDIAKRNRDEQKRLHDSDEQSR
jgi:isopropylmalate/homocitrate/citramalate synthase